MVTSSLMAQESGDAPQVLTTDLAERILVEEQELKVDFVIVDTDAITKVKINGVEEKVTPGDTVAISKTFQFEPGVTTIRVEVEDEKGNNRQREYKVYYKVPMEVVEKKSPEKKAGGVKLTFNFELRAEQDDNPTQDLSLPIPIGGIGDVEGQVADSEQADSRSTIGIVAGLNWEAIDGFAGYYTTSYGKPENESIGSNVMFLGAVYRFSGKNQPGLQMGYAWTDINLGGNNFSQNHTFSPGFETRVESGDKKVQRVYGLEYQLKSYSDEAREGASQMALKIDSRYTAPDKDSSRRVLQLGTNSDGSKESEYQFIGYKADWALAWDSGFLLQPGWGVQYRTYPNDTSILTTELGSTRLDIPFRFSLGIGMKFLKTFTALFEVKYTADISNDSPYKRTISGLAVQGSF